ncbi:hypothetical protein [Streptobacillus canis]|uniref:hypothetical protein n=1 Tax=Streptobacillus canis TaxID=2678686 RepID=UPI0012E0FDE3|nr:hypothetical protein [Streptobacillus canis]
MKKFFLIPILFLIISCSGITPISKYHIKEIASIASEKILNENFENVKYRDMRIYKKGYGTWYISAYGDFAIYFLEIDEDGNVTKYEKINYTE